MTTRRDFLKGMAALAVVPVVPAIAEAVSVRHACARCRDTGWVNDVACEECDLAWSYGGAGADVWDDEDYRIPGNAVRAVKSGDWSDPSVWSTGAVPRDGEYVVFGPHVVELSVTTSEGRRVVCSYPATAGCP